MSRRVVAVASLVLALAGCRHGARRAGSCRVVEASVKPAAGAVQVALSVRWTVAGKNYRTNKPLELGQFDAAKHTVAELQERYKVGAEVECSIDEAHPTRVELHGGDR